jgi:prepilin-type N-terminal cleavage/methylation domain-containing protein
MKLIDPARRQKLSNTRRIVAVKCPTVKSGQQETDHGFTLVELLVVLVVMPLIIGAISLGIVSAFSLQVSTSARLTDTVGAQIVSSNYSIDVQSAATLSLGTTLPATPLCADSSNPSEVQLLGLSGATGATTVSYVLNPDTSGTYSLIRNHCIGGTHNSTLVLTRKVLSTGTSACLVTGTITFDTNGPVCVVNSTAVPIAANTVSLVKVTVSEVASGYQYTLEATPRWATLSSVPTGKYFAALVLLGASCLDHLTVKPTGKLTINSGNGIMAIQNPCDSSILANDNNGNNFACAAGTYASCTIRAGAVVTKDPNLKSFDPSSTGDFGIGTNAGKSITPWTWPIEILGTPGDWLANFLAPLLPPGPNGTALNPCTSPTPPCKKTGKNVVCNPVSNPYLSDPNTDCLLKSGDTITFSPGSYWMPQFHLTNGANAVFGSASATSIIYFTNTTGAALQTGTSSTGNTLTATNTLFYVPSAQVAIANNSKINFSWSPAVTGSSAAPLSASNYYGVTIWDNSSTGLTATTGTVDIGNGGGGTLGGIYAPNGSITDSQVGTIDATFMEAQAVTISNNATVNLKSP